MKRVSLVFLVFLIVLLFFSFIPVPIVYGSPGHTFDTKARQTGAIDPVTLSYTCGDGATVLVLGIVVKGSNARTGGAPTYNGVAMTQANSVRTATETNCELWYMIAPPTGSAYTISVPNTGTKNLYFIASSYKAAAGHTSVFDVANGATGTTLSASVTLTPTAGGCVIVDICGTGHNNPPIGNQAALFSNDNGLFSDNGQYALQAAAAAITFTWSQEASDDWCIVAAAFKEGPLIDSHSEANWDENIYLRDLHPSDSIHNSAAGQSFQNLADTYKITSCKFYLKKTGSPTGTMYAQLYAHSGTYGSSSKPTGDALATSNGIDISTLTTSYQLIEFTFPAGQQYEMQPSTYYCIDFGFITSGTIDDTTNYGVIGIDYTSPTHPGNANRFANGAWVASSAYDLIFYVYGELVVPEGQDLTFTFQQTIVPTATMSATKETAVITMEQVFPETIKPISSLSVSKELFAPPPSTVGTSTSSTATSSPHQRKCFYTNGRFWAWYFDGTNFVYRSSADGSQWSDATSVGAVTLGREASVFFDGSFVHYTRYNAYNLFYRRGTPQSDGTINWSADEQTVHSGSSTNTFRYPMISVDSGGYAWIGGRHRVDTLYYPKVLKNANNDGTWSTATDFPYTLQETSDTNWLVQVVPLTNLKVYAIYGLYDVTPFGKLYNGNWGSEESDLTDYQCEMSAYISTVNDGDDIHLTYTRGLTFQIRYNKRTYGVGWQENDELVQDSVTVNSPSALTITDGDLYCFWTNAPSLNHIYYKKRVAGTWDTTPTDWIDESTDTLTIDGSPTCFYTKYGSYIGLLYTTKAVSPHNIKFAYLTMAPPEGQNLIFYFFQAIASIGLLAAFKETAFFFSQVTQPFAQLIYGKELPFILSQTVNPLDVLNVFKELAFNLPQTLRVLWSLSQFKELIFSQPQSFHPFWNLAQYKELLFPITQTVKPLWYMLMQKETAVTLEEFILFQTITPTALLTITKELALAFSQTISFAWQNIFGKEIPILLIETIQPVAVATHLKELLIILSQTPIPKAIAYVGLELYITMIELFETIFPIADLTMIVTVPAAPVNYGLVALGFAVLAFVLAVTALAIKKD